MLDPKLIEEHPELVRDTLRRRHADPALSADLDRLIGLSEERRQLISEVDGLRARRNALSREIGSLMKLGRKDEAEGAKAEVTAGNERTASLEARLAEIESARDILLLSFPNLLADDVPEGEAEQDNPTVRTWGAPPSWPFEARSHVDVGTPLGLDLERAARLTGTRFAVLKGGLARLERAILNYFLDLHSDVHGYTEVMVPYLVHRRILEGTGQLPKFEQDLFRLVDPLNGADTFLIPTAEVPVTNLHREEILDEAQLPIRYACFTPCFRAEAGSAGRDVRGVLRQHQFHKVELVWITTPEQSEAAHQTLVGHAEACLRGLELPYRVVLHCGGETSNGAARCYDLEVWLPSQGRYREVSSCSTFREFQSRRMQLRYRTAETDGRKGRVRLAHTLNGSGLAVGRTLVAVLENHQQEDGSVRIPPVLQRWMGQEVLRPPAT